MDLADEKIIETHLDLLIDGIQNNDLDTQNFNVYSKILKGSFFSNLVKHQISRRCAFPGCPHDSIRRSHSIPKSSSLLNIASNGHLLKPEVDLSSNELSMKMELIGINNASVFPGYCPEHETVFQVYEKDGILDEKKKALLQTYRSICRERVFREIEIEINNEAEKVYREKLGKEALKIFERSASKEYKFCKISSLRIEGGDKLLIFFQAFRDYILQMIKPLSDMENDIYNYLYIGKEKSNLLIKVVDIDLDIPIALCGYATVAYKEKENEDKLIGYLIMNIIPLEKKTYIVCAMNKKHSLLFGKYTSFSFQNAATLLNMIESFMVNGSDHWFMCPDYWNTIPREKQEKILFDILYTEDSFLDEYPISIFDDIRKLLIDTAQKNTSERELTADERKFIEKEQGKLKIKDFTVIKDEDRLIRRLFSKL